MGSVADASTIHRDVHSIGNGMKTVAKITKVISIPQEKVKLPNSPTGAKIWRMGEADGTGNIADALLVCREAQCIKNNLKMAENASKMVKIHQIRPKMKYSLVGHESKTPKRHWDAAGLKKITYLLFLLLSLSEHCR